MYWALCIASVFCDRGRRYCEVYLCLEVNPDAVETKTLGRVGFLQSIGLAGRKDSLKALPFVLAPPRPHRKGEQKP